MFRLTTATVFALMSLTTMAHAYIGPGAGAGTIAAVLGVLGAIAMAFIAIVWYPIKRVIRKRRTNKAKAKAE